MKINNIKQRLKKSILAMIIYWLLFSIILYFAANWIIFKPSKDGIDISKIAEISKNYEIKEIYKKDGKTLKAFFIPLKELESLKTMVKTEMENAFSLPVPLVVDIGIGKNWLEAH